MALVLNGSCCTASKSACSPSGMNRQANLRGAPLYGNRTVRGFERLAFPAPFTSSTQSAAPASTSSPQRSRCRHPGSTLGKSAPRFRRPSLFEGNLVGGRVPGRAGFCVARTCPGTASANPTPSPSVPRFPTPRRLPPFFRRTPPGAVALVDWAGPLTKRFIDARMKATEADPLLSAIVPENPRPVPEPAFFPQLFFPCVAAGDKGGSTKFL